MCERVCLSEHASSKSEMNESSLSLRCHGVASSLSRVIHCLFISNGDSAGSCCANRSSSLLWPFDRVGCVCRCRWPLRACTPRRLEHARNMSSLSTDSAPLVRCHAEGIERSRCLEFALSWRRAARVTLPRRKETKGSRLTLRASMAGGWSGTEGSSHDMRSDDQQ